MGLLQGFEEILIEEVRKKPVLYNTFAKDYRNALKTNQAWIDVAAAVFEQMQSVKILLHFFLFV